MGMFIHVQVQVENGITKGNMICLIYTRILNKNLLVSASDIKPNDNLGFKQDNDPKHTPNLSQVWFEKKDSDVFDWPSEGLGPSPLEKLLAFLEKR